MCVCKGLERVKVAQGTIQWQSVMKKNTEESDKIKGGRLIERSFEYQRSILSMDWLI
jgi:hypothetical protein